jgi:carbonic anhydrase/acetyltransferase-like protein (isoleucine patch superfamily)
MRERAVSDAKQPYQHNGYLTHTPKIDPSAFVAGSANLIGGVTLGARSSVWFQAVLRADDEPITVGEGTNIQDGCIIHIDPGEHTIFGDYVTVGHRAMVHGAQIENNVMIAIGAIVLTGARIGTNSIIGSGALVTEGKIIPPNSLVVGVPGRVIRTLSDEQASRIRGTAQTYIRRAEAYMAAGVS